MRAALITVVCFVTGCRFGFEYAVELPDASTTPPLDYASGTRLRAIVNDEIGQQSLARVGWFDTNVGEECNVELAEDGVMRCLPSRVRHGAQWSDPACTVPLMRRNDLLDAASCPSATLLGTIRIGDRARVVQVGAEHTGPIYQTGAGCQMVGGTTSRFYAVGAAIPVEQFVTFTDEVVRAGPLGYVQQVGEDGARELDPDHLVDLVTNERCTVKELTWGEAACLPDVPIGIAAFADAACSEPAIVVVDAPSAPTMLMWNDALCGYSYDEATVGNELTGYYDLSNGVCIARPTSAVVRAWRVTKQPLRTIAVATVSVDDGPGAIAQARWQFTSGHSLPSFLFDRRKQDFCTPTTMKDTIETVCAPLWTSSGGIYSDSTCSTSVGIAWPSCRGAWRSSWYPTAPFQWTCAGFGNGVRRYDVPVTGPAYHFSGTSCVAIDPSITVYTQSLVDYPRSEMVQLSRRRE